MDFYKLWPGKKILLVFGKGAFESAYSQSAPVAHLKNVLVIPCIDKNDKVQSIWDLYGGEPILVVDAQQHSYQETSTLHNDVFDQERVVCVTPDFPYWHHSFKIEEKPFGFFQIAKDKSALSLFCTVCQRSFETRLESKHTTCGHTICDVCLHGLNPICLHSSHKREYIPFEDAFLFEDTNVTYCVREGCESIVDPRVACADCGEGGFCTKFCLLLNHEC